ncbi:MAG: EAL domain-containing protein [Nitrosomonas sp.]|nr:EAL domain-containing protein [Nitrosomonas sp.]MBK7364495.1 EAL domain-containing protein [Nitrosomonas sp.]
MRAGQIKLLFQQTPSAFLATLLNSVILVSILWGNVPANQLISWIITVYILTLARYLFVLRYHQTKPPSAYAVIWGRFFILGVFLSGTLWGIAGKIFFIQDSLLHQLFLIYLLGGMVAGAMSTLSSYRGAFLTFSIPVTLPICHEVFSLGSEFHIAIASTFLLFLIMLWAISQRLHLMITDSLRLRFDNADLLSDLLQAKNEQQTINEALQTQIIEKELAQKTLQAINEQLEQHIMERTHDLVLTNDSLRREKELFRVTLASIGDAVITTDAQGNVTYLNPIAESLTGWHNAESIGIPLHNVFQTADQETQECLVNMLSDCLATATTPNKSQECLLIRKDQQESVVDYSVAPIHNDEGNIYGIVLTFRDVTEQRNLARKLAYQASHDPLTGLLNREAFENRLTKILGAAREDNVHALLYLDLDQFKVVNDTCGHSAGDELLRHITTLLQSQLRTRDTLARLGGDEFGIILEHCSKKDAIKIAQTLREAIQDYRFHWQDKSFTIGVSIGLYPITRSGENLSNVLSAADNACYAAKETGRNRVHVYQSDDDLLQKRTGEMQWLPRIQKAVIENRLCLFFQPILATDNDQTIEKHGEILLRLRDEQGNLIMPGAFLPPAERYDQMILIDRWVIEKAIAFIKVELQHSTKVIYAINLSAHAICSEDFLDFIVTQIKTHINHPASLCFEITENVALADPKHVKQFITTLKGLGCLFSLDDFGSGFSSFSYLKEIPIDFLKIDGRLIKDMTSDPIDLTMVQSIQNIGHVMGLKTIAEWVEDEATLQLLRDMNVDYAQGFWLARPQQLDETNQFH